jgi:hypothetical protein
MSWAEQCLLYKERKRTPTRRETWVGGLEKRTQALAEARVLLFFFFLTMAYIIYLIHLFDFFFRGISFFSHFLKIRNV